jgi:hypothetical protein
MLKIPVRRPVAAAVAVLLTGCATTARAQTSQPAPHDHAQMQSEATATPWHVMQDGIVYAELNHQGGPRGGTEFVAPNWWMGMASRSVRSSELTFTAMLSLDAATVGKSGYGEIFQVGETLDGHPLVDRQHPHDLFMQLAAVWKKPLTPVTSVTFAAAPVGEPALGPVAFMHRPSAAENPFAALGHHTFDSTHIAFGVVTAAVDHGRWTLEGSLFNGREPDEERWDFDFGPLDSVSARVWFRPTVDWEVQVSSGHLTSPEELEPGNVQRTTASAAWFRRNGADFSAVTAGYGVNAAHETHRQSVFVEGTRRSGLNSIFGRAELVDVETAKLLDVDHHSPIGGALTNTVGAFTAGAVRDVMRVRGFEGGVGASVSFYAVPDVLKETHGRHPVSLQLFFRLRPPAGPAGRMWNMRMSRPMVGDGMSQMHHHGG